MELTNYPTQICSKEAGHEQAFVHLHLHSHYSIRDGLIEFPKLFIKCREFSMSSVALTDHGTLAGLASFYSQALTYNIKPIVGCEFYVANDRFAQKVKGCMKNGHHLVLLAHNQIGLQNLLELDFQANTEGDYFSPRVDLKLLACHNEGLICLSGCLAGRIPQLIIRGENNLARQATQELHQIFADRFYLELQENGLLVQKTVNTELVKLGKEYGIQTVATNDNHFLEPEDADFFQQNFFGPTSDSFDSGKSQLHFKSTSRMQQDFSCLPQAIVNTVRIASRCELNLPPSDFINKLKNHQQRLEGAKKRLAAYRPLRILSQEDVDDLNELFAEELSGKQAKANVQIEHRNNYVKQTKKSELVMRNNDKPSGDREKLIKWRLENMIEMVKNVRDRGIISKLANEDKYIRIGGEQYMGVSLADKSPLTGYGNKAKTIETIQNNFENKQARELSGKTWESKKERRLQAWLIRQALVNNRSLLGPLNLASHFDELLFCLDEVSLGDRNHEVPSANDSKAKRPNVVRCDILAVGRREETYFPVLIELKCNRELDRLCDQLNNFIFDIEEHQSINDVFVTLMKTCSGISENKSFDNNFKKILVWPKCTCPQHTTTSKLISEGILQIEYSYRSDDINDINKWKFNAS